jgi:hypothetical protein
VWFKLDNESLAKNPQGTNKISEGLVDIGFDPWATDSRISTDFAIHGLLQLLYQREH